MFAKIAAILSTWTSYILGATHNRISAQSRAATFIEYALLAVIAIVVAAIFRNQLSGAFTNIMERVTGEMGRNG